MTDNDLHDALNRLFLYFEENVFVNNGVWSRKANLAFAFSDYIEAMSDNDISNFLKTDDAVAIDKFRLTARQGIELWLKQNMKTLMI